MEVIGKTEGCFLPNRRKVTLFYKILNLIHRFVVFFWRIKKKASYPPKRILLSNGGGFGDVVLCSGVVIELKRQFPECQIGFVVLKECRAALETIAHIDWIYENDYRDSPQKSLSHRIWALAKFVWLEQRRLAKQLRLMDYDCAIELRPFFPNMIPLFWKSKIPLRIGFTSSGNVKLLNAPVSWSKQEYLPHCYWDLLEKLGVKKEVGRSLLPKTVLPCPRLQKKLEPYLVFHPRSSIDSKDFLPEFWKTLHQKSVAEGYCVYFTGRGDRDLAFIDQIVVEPRYNLCNKLTWTEFVQFIKAARAVVSVDSVPVHLAASLNVPCLVLFKTTHNHKLWHPDVSSCKALGIESSVEVEDVMNILREWMPVKWQHV